MAHVPIDKGTGRFVENENIKSLAVLGLDHYTNGLLRGLSP